MAVAHLTGEDDLTDMTDLAESEGPLGQTSPLSLPCPEAGVAARLLPQSCPRQATAPASE